MFTASNGTVDFLNRTDFAYKQARQIPCETNAVADALFMGNLSELLSQTANEKIVVYYVDCVHPSHNTHSVHAWIEKGTQRELSTVAAGTG